MNFPIRPDKKTAAYGQRLLDDIRELFDIIHRRESVEPAQVESALREQCKKIIDRRITRGTRIESG